MPEAPLPQTTKLRRWVALVATALLVAAAVLEVRDTGLSPRSAASTALACIAGLVTWRLWGPRSSSP
jgi:hypothetical protein